MRQQFHNSNNFFIRFHAFLLENHVCCFHIRAYLPNKFHVAHFRWLIFVQSAVESRGVNSSCTDSATCRLHRLRQLCVFIGSSFKICSFLNDLPTELQWQAVLDEVSEDDGNNVDEEVDAEKSSTAKTALQSLNHLTNSAKDDVKRRIRGVMTRIVDSLAVCIRKKTAAVTSACPVPTPWHDVSNYCWIRATNVCWRTSVLIFVTGWSLRQLNKSRRESEIRNMH